MRSGDCANPIRVYNLQKYKEIRYGQVTALTQLTPIRVYNLQLIKKIMKK